MGFAAGTKSTTYLGIRTEFRKRSVCVELDATVFVAVIRHDLGDAIADFKPCGE